MRNLFQAVKEAVPFAAAARYLGLEPNAAGFVRCPFHEDRSPSMKLYADHYHCFGCHAHGDAVELCARLRGLRPGEAARALAEAFGVAL